MIAISNMVEKPKACSECPIFIGCYAGHWRGYKYCPLIDIVECWECEHYNGDEEYCEIDQFAREHGFCFYGKRRNDERIIE